MGSRVQKIAFIIFALMFVAIMAVLNTSILTLGTSSNEQLTNIVASDDSALNVYDDSTVYGATVINCAKAPDDVCSNPLEITVKTAAGGNDVYKTGSVYGVTGANEDNYINRSAKFHSELVYNENGVVKGITFTQES